ncbi:MAG: hypothetical protein KDD22_07160 [Bdellovibrionales bacterium]|nr:hypothetical protein [Bdellovibrionales bacterium]
MGKPVFDFAMYPGSQNGEEGLVISFRQLGNVTTLGRTSGFVEGDQLFEGFVNQYPAGFSTEIVSEFRSQTQMFTLTQSPGSADIEIRLWDHYSGAHALKISGHCRLMQ